MKVVHITGPEGYRRSITNEGDRLMVLEKDASWHYADDPACICAAIPAELSVLEEAQKVVGERAKTHGEDTGACFDAIAASWAAYLSGRHKGPMAAWELTGFDVAQMMVLFKVARSVSGDRLHKDHYIDQAGYSELAWRLAKGQR